MAKSWVNKLLKFNKENRFPTVASSSKLRLIVFSFTATLNPSPSSVLSATFAESDTGVTSNVKSFVFDLVSSILCLLDEVTLKLPVPLKSFAGISLTFKSRFSLKLS